MLACRDYIWSSLDQLRVPALILPMTKIRSHDRLTGSNSRWHCLAGFTLLS